MSRKSFATYAPSSEIPEIDIDGEVFHMKQSIPGDVLLDFLDGANTDDPSSMAKTVRSMLFEAIVPEELEQFKLFIRDPKNNVTLDVLAEIAGYAAEVLSGGNPRPVSSLTG